MIRNETLDSRLIEQPERAEAWREYGEFWRDVEYSGQVPEGELEFAADGTFIESVPNDYERSGLPWYDAEGVEVILGRLPAGGNLAAARLEIGLAAGIRSLR